MVDEVRLAPWEHGDAWLTTALNGSDEVMKHLGGAETAEKIAERQAGRVGDPRQFCVVAGTDRVGWIGFWPREWHGEDVWETGWAILPAFHGRGIASAAARLVLVEAGKAGGPRWVHAFPGAENPASNGVCRKAGFALVEADVEDEYPPGHRLVINDWRAACR